MKIAIYYPWLYLKSGLERTILESVKKSKHDYTIFTNHYDKNGTYPEFKKLNVIELKKIPVRRNLISVIKAALIITFQKVNLKEFDSLIVHSEGLGDLFLIRNRHINSICFCHTPLRPVFDSEYRRLTTIKRSKIMRPLYEIFYTLFTFIDRYLWGKYNYIFFNSKETFRRALKGGLINTKSKFKILHPGINHKSKKPADSYKKYFLVPGRIMWTKNIELALLSYIEFLILSKKNREFKLIIAGQVDQKSKPYYKDLINLSKNYKTIKFIRNPSDKQMAALYKNCYAGLVTSFNEDWGITPLEANSYGKAVIAVKMGGFKESQINNKTGFLVKPDPQIIAQKMHELAKNKFKTKKMGLNAYINSKKYSWAIFIDKYDKVLQNIISA